MDNTTLPAGVQHVGDASPAAAQAPVQQQQVQQPAGNTNIGVQDQHESTPPAKWNLLEIAAGVVIVTLSIFVIHYLRRQTYQQSEDSQDKDMKIKVLQSDVSKMKLALGNSMAA